MAARQGLSSTTEEIRDALRHVLRAGFPITDDTAGDLLPDQRVVIAHAQHPDERGSRVTALERVVRQILKEFGQSTRGQAARALFAVDKTLRGTTLTHRRGVAARILDRDPDHTRKHIEPSILDEVAFAFHQENLRYQPVTDNVEGLVALAGWHGGLGDDEAKRLRYALARAGTDDRGAFVAELKKGSAA